MFNHTLNEEILPFICYILPSVYLTFQNQNLFDIYGLFALDENERLATDIKRELSTFWAIFLHSEPLWKEDPQYCF